MKIVDSIPHPHLKITVFKSGQRFIVKFDGGDHDYSIKLREGEADHIQDVRTLVSPDFIAHVEHTFASVASYRMKHRRDASDDHFEII